VIVADTGAVIALIDADDRHHGPMRALFESNPDAWILPWAILPEVDYLVATHVGRRAEETFLADLAGGAFAVEWGDETDLTEAHRICRRHKALELGLVDAVVITIAERLRPDAIATLDLRHFGAVPIRGDPKLFPRDLR
jgi:uncharacterized protein